MYRVAHMQRIITRLVIYDRRVYLLFNFQRRLRSLHFDFPVGTLLKTLVGSSYSSAVLVYWIPSYGGCDVAMLFYSRFVEWGRLSCCVSGRFSFYRFNYGPVLVKRRCDYRFNFGHCRFIRYIQLLPRIQRATDPPQFRISHFTMRRSRLKPGALP